MCRVCTAAKQLPFFWGINKVSESKNNCIFLSFLKECNSLAAHIFQTTDRDKTVFNKPLVFEGTKCKQSSISCTRSSDEAIVGG